MKTIRIKNRGIGEGHPVFIIAEAGVNHNGDLNMARELIDVAVKSGADAVKFQTFSSEHLIVKGTPKAEYQKKTTDKSESQYDMLKRLELTRRDHVELINYASRTGILFLSTPATIEDVEMLSRLKVPAYKISSWNLTDHLFLSDVAGRGLPLLLSTGMSTLAEIEEGLEVIKRKGNDQVALLHCTSNYPTNPKDCNLNVLNTLRQAFQLPVGYSDHTMGIAVSLAAVAMGADIIEKHFTLDNSLSGPDHKASLEPSELKSLVEGIRIIEKAKGSSLKQPVAAEIEIRKSLQKSIVASQDINKGVVITQKMLCCKRPGTGMPPKWMAVLVGRKARFKIKKDELITWNKVQ